MSSLNRQSCFGFEQAIRDAEQAAADAKLQAKLAAQIQRRILQRQEEIDKNTRRWRRAMLRKEKSCDEVAVCGIRVYNRSPLDRALGRFWKDCQGCHKPLHYYKSYQEAESKNRGCQL